MSRHRTDKALSPPDDIDAIWRVVDKHCRVLGDKGMTPLVRELTDLFRRGGWTETAVKEAYRNGWNEALDHALEILCEETGGSATRKIDGLKEPG